MILVYFIIGCIAGALVGVGVALALDFCTCVFYVISCGSTGATGIGDAMMAFFAIVGAVVGGIIGIYRALEASKTEKEEKQRIQDEAIKKVVDWSYVKI